MKIKTAEITARGGLKFAVAQVDRSVIENRELAMHIVRNLQPKFPQMHVVLWYWESGQKPLFFGRPDIAQKLSGLAMASIPWEECEIPDQPN